MIRLAILGDIGSGKSFVAKSFGYPVFNADFEVGKLYQKDKKIFKKLNKVLPQYITSFPVQKKALSEAILEDKRNLSKIIKIVHLEIRKKMKIFLRKNENKKMVVLDIPLLLENKIYLKDDILIFVQAKKKDIFKRLKKRKNFNKKLYNVFKKIQLTLYLKKKKSHFIIKNDFTKKTINKNIKIILSEILQ